MELSAFSVVDGFPPESGRERLDEVLALAEIADRSGLSTLWVAEHHFHDGGVCPSPAVLLAAAAQRTRRIRLGSMVSVLPFHPPVEVAEQFAMVDRLSGGRLNLGIGSGYIPMEFEGFGLDPKEKRERFDRALTTLLSAFRGEPVGPPGPSGFVPKLNVAPVQRPHPPIWIAAQRREALPFVARAGYSVALIPYATVETLDELATSIREFKRAVPAGARVKVSAAVHTFVGLDFDQGRRALQSYIDRARARQSTYYEAKLAHAPEHASAEALIKAGLALVGPAERVRAGLRRFAEAGVDELLGIFDFGGLALPAVQASVEAAAPLVC